MRYAGDACPDHVVRPSADTLYGVIASPVKIVKMENLLGRACHFMNDRIWNRL
jgi:hypothetical protein